MITGANAGIGKEAARQVALKSETEKVILVCRNETKAKQAKLELEQQTGKKVFEILIMDTSDLDSVKQALQQIDQPIDALLMNAGGLGGKTPDALTKEGATHLSASNVIGHALLLEELLERKLLLDSAVFVASEAVRGVPQMGMKKPNLKSFSVDEHTRIINGRFFGGQFDAMQAYGPTKLVGVMWMSSLARAYPRLRLLSISPGATGGTNAADDLPAFMKFMMKKVAMGFILPLFGMSHSLETGSKRLVDALYKPAFASGRFYASRENKMSGPVVDQAPYLQGLNNERYQDNARAAVRAFITTVTEPKIREVATVDGVPSIH